MQLGVSLGIPYTLGKPAAVFSPLDLSPKLWLDASDTSTITESGGAVSQWDDKSGNGYNVTQGTAAAQPTTGTRTINSLNVIDFDGSADYLQAATAGDWAFLSDGTTYLVGAVLSSDAPSNENRVAFGSMSGPVAGGVYWGHVNFSKTHVVTNAISNAVENASISGSYIITLIGDPDNATAADRSLGYIKGGTVAANNSLATTATAGNIALTIGNRGASLFWDGVIAELVIVSGANATETNRQALRDYLNDKWAVY